MAPRTVSYVDRTAETSTALTPTSPVPQKQPKQTKDIRMSNQYSEALSHATSTLRMITQTCMAARRAALTAQETHHHAFLCHRSNLHLSTLTTPNQDLDQSTSLITTLCTKNADLALKQLKQAAVNAGDVLAAREKEYRQAFTEEKEARRDLDQYLLSQGSLRHYEPVCSNDGERKSPIQGWRDNVNAAFAVYSTMTTFPSPPPLAEGKGHTIGCPSRPQYRHELNDTRPIEACECAVRAAFRVAGVNLRTERLRWEPESFPEEFRVQAGWVRRVVEGIFEGALQPAVGTRYVVSKEEKKGLVSFYGRL
ncbi:hypothetical protein LTR62_001651 [Meristemomyces frigidus]|uniref:Uncharacterized protein n=1 Tax=Meristemomyces frigidus TaxID=1508187 RepID=A0AAN7TFK8_9PEZI|nr:hypothetical protein LTR62_001651 [Meristemomyces frigidus]